MQEWSLKRKLQVTETRIIEWYQNYNGNVYVSFSGGKDSTVLLHIARRIYPDIEAVFVDTGLEYPEIREFVKSIDNVIWLKPDMNFKKVIEKYGYPVISKKHASNINKLKNNNLTEKYKNYLLWGDERGNAGRVPQKFHKLIDADFNVSDQCCNAMKKKPMKKFEKLSGKHIILGTTADESVIRKREWLKNGCNAFDGEQPQSRPMSFWTEQDILQYIKENKIPYASVYGDIVEDICGKLITTGEHRTGCVFCGFGCHLEKEPNRFQRMKDIHPALYNYCFKSWESGGLELGKVLDYIDVKY